MSCNNVNCGGNNSNLMSGNTMGGGSGIRINPNENVCIGDMLDPNARFLILNPNGKGFDITQADTALFNMILNGFFIRVKNYSIMDSTVPNTNNNSYAEIVIPPDTNFFMMYPSYDTNIDQRRWLLYWKLINYLNEEEPCVESENDDIDITVTKPNINISFVPASKGCCGNCHSKDCICGNSTGDCGCDSGVIEYDETSQFNCKDDYSLMNRIVMLDIPSNMFTKIRFKNDIYKQPLPIKFLFINKGI